MSTIFHAKKKKKCKIRRAKPSRAKGELTKYFMATGDGFSCVFSENQTLCVRGSTRYAFIAGPCPSPGPLSGHQAGARLCTSHGPLSLITRPTPSRVPPLVGCSPKRDVTPRHASDNTDITTVPFVD